MINFLVEGHFSLFGNAVTRGYKTYCSILKEYPALSDFSGKNIQPQILHACTEEALTIILSMLPQFTLSRENNSRKTYQYLKVEDSQKFRMTVSRVSKPNKVPRPAIFREDYLQGYSLPFAEFEQARYLPYIILTHGLNKNQNEIFAGIGMPDSFKKNMWTDYISLENYLYQSPVSDEEVAQTQQNVMPKLRVITNEYSS